MWHVPGMGHGPGPWLVCPQMPGEPTVPAKVTFRKTTPAARGMGMQGATAQACGRHDPVSRTVLAVSRRQGGCMAAKALKDGDLLLRLQGKLVNSFREVALDPNSPARI